MMQMIYSYQVNYSVRGYFFKFQFFFLFPLGLFSVSYHAADTYGVSVRHFWRRLGLRIQCSV